MFSREIQPIRYLYKYRKGEFLRELAPAVMVAEKSHSKSSAG
jgi:hypothetical protein